MFKEHPHVRQVPGETPRRWFTSGDLDLTLWQKLEGPLLGFQLTYTDGPHDRVLTWWHDKGLTHEILDPGEDRPVSYKMAPILLPGQRGDMKRLIEMFRAESGTLEPETSRDIISLLVGYEKG